MMRSQPLVLKEILSCPVIMSLGNTNQHYWDARNGKLVCDLLYSISNFFLL